MLQLLNTILTIPEATSLAEAVANSGCPAAVTGLAPAHRAQLAAALSAHLKRPLVMICSDESEANRLSEDLSVLLGTAPLKLFARELFVRAGTVISRQWEIARISTLYALSQTPAVPLICTAEGLLQKTSPKDTLSSAAFTLTVGERYDLSELPARLIKAGYSRCEQVEGVGQFALRGGILDVFSPLMEEPVRCEFFDDEIDSLGTFDTVTQRRTKNISSALLLPATELLPNTELVSVFDYLPSDAILCMSESMRVNERMKTVLFQSREDTESLLASGETDGDLTRLLLSQSEWQEKMEQFSVCMMEALPTSRYPLKPRTLLTINAKQLSAYGGNMDTAASDITHYLSNNTSIVLLCGNQTRCRNMQRMLSERGISAALDFALLAMPKPGEVRIVEGALSAGAEYPQLSLVLLTEGQLTGVSSNKRTTPKSGKKDNRQKLLSYTDLTPGDLVVHTHHGIGRFEGMRKMPVDGVEKDYIKIAYSGGDSLYVPATQLDLVSKYIGGGGDDDSRPMKLNKLGGSEWKKQKSRAKAAAKDLAKGLIALYAERQRRPGFAFSPDSPWQKEFEDAFDYAETDDQLRCIEDIKKDMERPTPMDRLLCGDVGYGKTEVALRAVMKCILDGKQAAILVPTTVLAQQHFTTAVNRFRSFPVEIRVLSRFQTPGQVRQILYDLSVGKVDLLIGTHKLLQKSVVFKDLGLLVIDEEQRFGVSHKEKLKEMSKQVDVLTLSATPIPRTLNMALSGLRDMSTLEEPPRNRQPVQTYVVEHDWMMLADAIRREVDRGGQVYYLHNRVDSIDRTASRIKKLVGEDVNVVIGHGKMGEKELSHVMQQMVEGTAQVLVCTTIIETGIDIANANTLIIEDADKMGLAQLHQIRGRIGRSARRAYAYMTYRPGKILTEIASKRLTAIKEYVEFGSGFKIAMRDLEIRGAGNLLGSEQSGYMMSVGYDMYLQLLEDAVLEERGEKRITSVECAADLTINANIPDRYVPSPEQRMDLYRRIAAIRTKEDASDLVDELMDRYGDPPQSVYTLLDVALLRADAAEVGISDISQRGDKLKLIIADFAVSAIAKLCGMSKYRQRLSLAAGDVPTITLAMRPKEDVLAAALAIVEDLRLAGVEKTGETEEK
ncbi:MAG: transcription-repair coupling factor [Oscillospiraceae bacterium]|nr:transcription-repair coupling factor [Oscillospiraceae bacterium]